MFFVGITIIFLLFLTVVSLGVFFSEPEEIPPTLVFNKPKVNIDMSIFDSALFQGLRPFAEMTPLFSYKALGGNNQLTTGFISADSAEQAVKTLQELGLSVSELKEVETGRENPFISYY